jgi:catechol 2,3-dioxygenase-like lactoylglutathione lyase family enzyme
VVTDIGDSVVNVGYLVDDLAAAVDFYTTHLGFSLRSAQLPAFADVTRGPRRLLLAGPTSSAARPMPDGRQPGPGGRTRIHQIVDDIAAEEARLRTAGVGFGSDIIIGRGGCQIVLDDPAGNPIELFTPAAAR